MDFQKLGEKIGAKIDKAMGEVEKVVENVSESISNALKESVIKNEDVTIILNGKDLNIRGDLDSITFNDKPYYKKEQE